MDDLLETLLLVADMAELKANPDHLATGTVIEAKLDKGRGPVSTLLVQTGTLRTGDALVVGTAYGRVRKMVDDRGREIKKALPSTPVEIIGLNDVPIAGDVFKAFDDDKKARHVAEATTADSGWRRNAIPPAPCRWTIWPVRSKQGDVQDINIIIKADVQGSAEAVKASMERLDVQGVRVNVIRSTAGQITESDIMLASASNAIIYGFNVRPERDGAQEGGRRRRRDPSAQHHLQGAGGNGACHEGHAGAGL